MFRRIIKTTKSLFLPDLSLSQQEQELSAPSSPAVDNPTTFTSYPVDMVQTRMQSQVGDGTGIKSTDNTGPTEHTPISNKRAIGGNDSPASVSRKRRKVIIVEESVGSPEGVADPEMEDSIIVLPDLPVRSKDKVDPAEREAQETMILGTLVPEEGKTRSDKPPKPAHTRFTSEEPEPRVAATAAIPRGDSTRPVVEGSENDESEDDAPEVVTLLSGHDQVRLREGEAAKALERQEVGAKKRRKERDARLKEQAASSKRNKKRKFRELEEDVAINTEPKDGFSLKSSLPALLPEDILLAEPTMRPPTPPLERNGQKQPQPAGKYKMFKEEKPPKDVKRGPVSVRVLESTSKFLTPKVGKVSSSLKQRWLAGRTGKNGRGGIERRKVRGGFLRR